MIKFTFTETLAYQRKSLQDSKLMALAYQPPGAERGEERLAESVFRITATHHQGRNQTETTASSVSHILGSEQ